MNQEKIDISSSAGQTYLTLLQGTISSMRSNSALCKTLCVTLVAAVGAIAVTAQNSIVLLICILPIVLCGVLDAFYLSLEKGYRDKYNMVVQKLRLGELEVTEIYDMSAPTNYLSVGACKEAFTSWAVWLVYCGMLGLVLILNLLL